MHSTCVFCDGGCKLSASMADDVATFAPINPAIPAICSKAVRWDEIRRHPSRITHPLKNVGMRGEPRWEKVSWNQALDEIAQRLSAIIAEYGPESIAFSEMALNHGFGGITRRFMNHLGSPNYITALDLCMGNTAQVHRATYGWFTSANWETADCIVYFGQNRGTELWPREYYALASALERGAKLIVVDPRLTETAERADYHLRINYGTDAALVLGWINVIIEEELYDVSFVEQRTVGFDDLADRAREYPPERVADICGVSVEEIRATARAYACSDAAIIPWGATADMQRNSTSLLRGQCILRAICGFLNKSELVYGPPSGISVSEQLYDYSALPKAQKEKQIGIDSYPLFSFKGNELYDKAMRRAGFDFTVDIMSSSCMAHPSSLFAAMRGEGPYPVKAFFSVANNTVMSFANTQGIVEALMNQDLVVTFEVNMTPTAQLSDYVWPGDMWMERDTLGPMFDNAPMFSISNAVCKPPKDCRCWYDVVKGLADRMGIGKAFPWHDARELYDWRLSAMGTTWEEAKTKPILPGKTPAFGSFLTPSGKVELSSSVLAALGYDPLPYYEEPIDPSACEDRPFVIFAGAREPANYNTNFHQVGFLREREPEPKLFIHPDDARALGIAEGDWTQVTTGYGSIELLAHLDDRQKKGSLRVPHGWWKPETESGLAAGLSCALLHNDGVLFSDDAWNLDPEQGLANLRGGIHANVQAI